MKKLTVLTISLFLLFCTNALSFTILDSFTLDLSAIDASLPTVEGIQQFTFVGIAHSETVVDQDPAGLPSPGDIFIADGFLNATTYTIGGNTVVDAGGSILNTDYELTFDFSVAGQNTDAFFINGDAVVFSETIAPGTYGGEFSDNILDIYVDWPANSNLDTADGFTDSPFGPNDPIAQFLAVPNEPSGVFTTGTYDGSVDITFSLLWAEPGVFLDEFGNDLGTDALINLFAITDSNFDADPTNQGGFSVPEPTNWNTYFSRDSAGTPTGFFSLEDGSARLGAEPVPEPSTFLLLGAGLLGLGIMSRKKFKK